MENQMRLSKIFYPYAVQKQQVAQTENKRFVHYTSAETAMSIIQNKQIWMRNATCMNDFMEVQYGLDCLNTVYESPAGERFRQMLDKIFPGVNSDIKTLFNGWVSHFKTDTYLTCISEHADNEDFFGRLSMWRAYGKMSGVALVLNNNAMLATSDALKAYTNPVAYLDNQGVEEEFNKITNNIEKEIAFLNVQNRENIRDIVFNVFKFAALCIKHPGFKEEKEWRIVYSPTMMRSDHLIKDIRVVNGTPQEIYKIPLKDIPEENFFADIPKLINRIIIGPSEYPLAIYKAFVDLLASAGVVEPYNKVFISDIPLRR